MHISIPLRVETKVEVKLNRVLAASQKLKVSRYIKLEYEINRNLTYKLRVD